MEKSDILKIVVILIAVAFIVETYYFSGGSNKLLPDFGGSKNHTGTATFNGTVRTYEPGLILTSEPSADVLDQLRSLDMVRDVKTDQGQIIVRTQSRDDVLALTKIMLSKNLSPIAILNVAIPSVLYVNTGEGVFNATNNGGIIQIVTEPLLEPGTEVGIAMTVIEQNGRFLGYIPESARLLLERRNMDVNATIVSMVSRSYTYTIPWESRNSLGSLGNTSNGFQRYNTLIFSSPLTTAEVVSKRQLSYITYIDPNSAEVGPDFIDAAKARSDFSMTNVTFRSSKLVILANETPEIPFNTTSIIYRYVVNLPASSEGFEIPPTQFDFESSILRPINSTVTVKIIGVAASNKLVSVIPG